MAAALANVRMRDRVREEAAESRAAEDSLTTTSSSEFELSHAHKCRLRVKPSGRRVSGKQQLSEAVKAHAQTKKVKASAVVEAKRVVRHPKDESAKPQAVTEQAAKDQVAKGQTATGEAAKPQAGTEKAAKDQVAKGQTVKGQAPNPQADTVEGGTKRDPTAGFVADWVAAKNEAAKQQEANEDEPEEQPEEPEQVRPFEVHLKYGRPNSTTSNIELEPLEWRFIPFEHSPTPSPFALFVPQEEDSDDANERAREEYGLPPKGALQWPVFDDHGEIRVMPGIRAKSLTKKTDHVQVQEIKREGRAKSHWTVKVDKKGASFTSKRKAEEAAAALRTDLDVLQVLQFFRRPQTICTQF